jgi:hypothetical protein
VSATIHFHDGVEVKQVEDGEEFTTILQWGVSLHCYDPDREGAEEVYVPADKVDVNSDQEERINSDSKVYGDIEAWKDTPFYWVFDRVQNN